MNQICLNSGSESQTSTARLVINCLERRVVTHVGTQADGKIAVVLQKEGWPEGVDVLMLVMTADEYADINQAVKEEIEATKTEVKDDGKTG